MTGRPVTTRAVTARAVTARAGIRHWGRLPVVAAAMALALVLWPSTAAGHAQLVAIDPPDGARLDMPPSLVTLTFNEPVALATRGLEVIDGEGRSWDAGPEEADGPVARQPVAPLADGWYVVRWAILSQDGHIVRGSATFGVGESGSSLPSSVAPLDVEGLMSMAMRGLADLALLAAVGAWSAWWLLRARSSRVRRLALTATWTALAGTLAWASLQLIQGGTDWAVTPYAVAAWLRLLLVGAAILLARSRPWVAVALLLAATWTLALGGHATGSLSATLLVAAHLSAAALWLGAAPAVALVLWGRDLGDQDAIAVVRRFSRLAGLALVAVALAGTLAGLSLTEGLADGLTSPYVVILGAKAGIVGVAALVGAFGRWSLGRDPRRQRLRRLFGLDVVLLVVVVGLSAALPSVAPHRGHGGDAGSSRCAMRVGDDSVAVILDPGRVGTNRALVSGVEHDVISVTLAMLAMAQGHAHGAPLELSLGHALEGWSGSMTLPFAGEWQATLVIRTDRFTEARASCSLALTP